LSSLTLRNWTAKPSYSIVRHTPWAAFGLRVVNSVLPVNKISHCVVTKLLHIRVAPEEIACRSLYGAVQCRIPVTPCLCFVARYVQRRNVSIVFLVTFQSEAGRAGRTELRRYVTVLAPAGIVRADGNAHRRRAEKIKYQHPCYE